MDCGNWFVTGMPHPLKTLVMLYQDDMHLTSFSQAIRKLLETHPEIDKRIAQVYAGIDQLPK